jgi:hypothetical protein
MKKLAFLTVFLALSSFAASAQTQTGDVQNSSAKSDAEALVIDPKGQEERAKRKYDASLQSTLGLTDEQMKTLQPLIERMRKNTAKPATYIAEIKKVLKKSLTSVQIAKLDELSKTDKKNSSRQ